MLTLVKCDICNICNIKFLRKSCEICEKHNVILFCSEKVIRYGAIMFQNIMGIAHIETPKKKWKGGGVDINSFSPADKKSNSIDIKF